MVFILESHFKIFKTIQDRIKERKEEEDLHEQRKKQQSENLEARVKAINDTTNILNEINSLVSEVRFYDEDNDNINHILKKISSTSIHFSDMINNWNFDFQH